MPCDIDPDWWKLPALDSQFESSSVGAATHRDHFAVAREREVLLERLRCFFDTNISHSEIKRRFNLTDTKDWNLRLKRHEAFQEGFREEKLIPYSYRPFDRRWVYYSSITLDRPRTSVLERLFADGRPHLLYGRAGLNVGPRSLDWTCYGVADTIPDLNFFARGGARASLGPRTLDLETLLLATFSSPAFRQEMRDGLYYGSPRIPVPSDAGAREHLAALGERLMSLHTLNLSSAGMVATVGIYPEGGSHKVARLAYDPSSERISINESQWYGGVKPAVWHFTIGGCRIGKNFSILGKWLDGWKRERDSEGRKVAMPRWAIERTFQIITAIQAIRDLEPELDRAYLEGKASGWLSSADLMP